MANFVLLAPCAAFVAFALAALYLAHKIAHEAPPQRALARLDVFYLLSGALYILIARLPILFLSRDVQADEAQYAANALIAKGGWLNWDNLDSGSSGPLQSMFQAWPLLYGGDITFTTVHLTGVVLVCALAASLYAVLRLALDRLSALIFTAPVVLFMGGATYWELVCTSSLLAPLTLVLLGVWAALWLWRAGETPAAAPRRVCLEHAVALAAAFGLGLIAIIKPHVIPLGGYTGLALAIAYARAAGPAWPRRIGRVALAAAAAAAPMALSVLGVLSTGRFEDFVLEVFGYTGGYVSGGAVVWFWTMVGFVKRIAADPYLAAVFVVLGAPIVVCGAFWIRHWRRSAVFTWLALGLAAVAGVSILAPGRVYLYYLQFAIATLPLAGAVLTHEAFASAPALKAWAARRRPWHAIAAIVLLMAPGAVWNALKSPAYHADAALALNGPRFHSPRMLAFATPDPNARLVVFGYMSRFYVDSQLRPGTRETSPENMIMDRPHRPEYWRRYLEEFDASRPEIFIDAIRPGSFVYVDPAREGPQTVPGLGDRIARRYDQISAAQDAACSQLYLRKDIAASYRARTAAIASITASAALQTADGAYEARHVVDRHIFEDCVDRWLGQTGAPGWLQMQLAAPQRVAQVSLLNTRGGYRAPPPDKRDDFLAQAESVADLRAARHAEIILMNGEEIVARRRVAVDGYPYWTKADFADAPLASAVRIEFPDWRGHGPGLNEVVVTTPAP